MAEYRLPTIPEFKKAESGQSPDLSFESSIFDRATRHRSSLARRRGLFGLGGFGRADPIGPDSIDLLGEQREFKLLAHPVPARNPRTECFCHPVSFTRTSNVAPSGRRSRATILSCLESGLIRSDDALVAFAETAAVFFAPDRLARLGRSLDLAAVDTSGTATSSRAAAAMLSDASATSATSIALRPALV